MMTHGDWYKQVYTKTIGMKAPDKKEPSKKGGVISKKEKMKHEQEIIYWKKMYHAARKQGE